MQDQLNQQAPQPAPANQQQPTAQQAGGTKVCKKCSSSIPRFAKSCPQCGANQNPFYKRAWFWVLVALLAIILMFAGCMGAFSQAVSESTNTISSGNAAAGTAGPSDATGGAAPDAGKGAEKYAIADEALVDKGYGSYTITGTFTNLTDKKIAYVQVSYTLHDKDGAQVGTAYANTSNLEANGTWKFEAFGFVSGDNAPVSFKRSDVTGF